MKNTGYLIGRELFYFNSYKTNKLFLFHYFKVRENSYIGHILYRLWEYYLKNSISLYRDYKRDYRKDYKSYSEYLERHYNIPSTLVEKLIIKKVKYKNLDNEPDNGIHNFIQMDDCGLNEEFLKYIGIEYLEDYNED